MTAQLALILAGWILQVLGLAATARGAVRTWNEFSPDERILDPARTRIGSASATARRKIRSLLGQPQLSKRTSGGGIDTIGVTSSVTVRKQFGELDSEAEVPAALSELDHRTREIMDRLHDVRDSLTNQHSQLKDRIAALEGDLAVRVADLGQQDRRVAIGGVKTVLWGLAFVATGVSVQTLAAYFPAA